MGAYEAGAEFYDLIYAEFKDYDAEARWVAERVLERHPGARTLLDVGCGTGVHAAAFARAGFSVTGVDVEPEFVRLARERRPDLPFVEADMRTLELPDRYDVVTSLFGVIGYARTPEGLHQAISRMAEHLAPGGVLVVEPWFEPGVLTDGWISTHVARSPEIHVCRMSRTVVDGGLSHLEFEYLIGRAGGVERRTERHTLGLFSASGMEAAFRAAGLEVERLDGADAFRGLYLARRTLES
jgi:SAM-dependent methyltransferase